LGEKEKLGALSVRRAVTLSPAKAQGVIREAARIAMGRIGEIEPLRVERPYTIRLQYIEEKYAERAMQMGGVRRVDGRTIEQVRERISDFII
jgi:D-aminopeptidase